MHLKLEIMAKNNINITPQIEATLTKVKIQGMLHEVPTKTNQEKIELAMHLLDGLLRISHPEEVTDLMEGIIKTKYK